LKGAAVLALVGCAYFVGAHVNLPQHGIRAARAVVPPSASSTSAEIPQAFREQLQTRPTVTPAPGNTAPAAKPGEDSFGLEN
jgi:hypothetical protein